MSDLHNITDQIDEASAETSTQNDVTGDIEAETGSGMEPGDDLLASPIDVVSPTSQPNSERSTPASGNQADIELMTDSLPTPPTEGERSSVVPIQTIRPVTRL